MGGFWDGGYYLGFNSGDVCTFGVYYIPLKWYTLKLWWIEIMWISSQFLEILCLEESPLLQALHHCSRSNGPHGHLLSTFYIFLPKTFEKHTAFPNIIPLKFKEVRVLCFALNWFEVYCKDEVHLNNSL